MRIAEFEKVSQSQFEKDWTKAFPEGEIPAYQLLPLPKRATSGSAGYDFYSPLDFVLKPGETILIPTGIRAIIDEGWALFLFPRSGLGFKYRFQLDNSVGIIDADYADSDNEGHIHLKMTNDSRSGKVLEVRKGTGVAQGIFLPFGITRSDNAEGMRNGGFGSTDRIK